MVRILNWIRCRNNLTIFLEVSRYIPKIPRFDEDLLI